MELKPARLGRLFINIFDSIASKDRRMIFSELHNFLFIKGHKVASTSVEVALSAICGPNDIITPITPVDELHRINLGYRHAQNYGADPEKLAKYIEQIKSNDPSIFRQGLDNQKGRLKKPRGKFHAHQSLKRAWKRLKERCNGHTRVIAICRSPYQTLLSRLNHNATFLRYQKTGIAVQSTPEERRQALSNWLHQCKKEGYQNNLQKYQPPSDKSAPRVKYLRFESIQADIKAFLDSLSISNHPELPHLKKGVELQESEIKELATNEELSLINNYFKPELEEFNYKLIS